jgi:phenylalanyl-tRNA synthetase beta chain
MKVLLSWLREFAPFEGDPVALGETMSDLGMAVESIDRLGEGLEGVVLARVVDLRPHPDADKIQLVEIDPGNGESQQVVCGAFNMAVGDIVPLATLGTTMPNGMRIERRKMRGEWSNGMLCSGAELGLGDDHSGILVLPSDLEPGTDLRAALGIEPDVLYDLEINPNRPDAMSVAGVARDLAARLAMPFAIPEPAIDADGGDASRLCSVEIVDGDLCGRFHATVLRGVSVGSSPGWMAKRLLALGMRPINSIVDVSNYVMLELGQPNHTYDLAKVPEGALRIRWARPGETITTLDDVERRLSSSDGVIADRSDTAIGIAGVMGGASTEIGGETTDVLLEMAWWHPMAIAVSSKRLGLRSEASMRFERGTDADGIGRAARRFAQLLLSAGGSLVDGSVDARGDLPAPARVQLRTSRVNGLLGTDLSADDIELHLDPIGFVCERDGDDHLVTVPSFRPDTRTETDVIEEVARHRGYSTIPRTVPPSTRIGGLTDRQRLRRLIRQILVGFGLDEAMPMPFLAPDDLDRAGLSGQTVSITNPLAAEESILRSSLRPGLLAAVAYNRSHRNSPIALFELGTVFSAPEGGDVLPREPEHLALAMADRSAHAAVDAWAALVDALDPARPEIRQGAVAGLHPTRSAELYVGGEQVGSLGEIDPAVLDRFRIDVPVGWLEVDLDRMLRRPSRDRIYRHVSRYPSSDLDLAFEVDEAVPAAELARVIEEAEPDLLTQVRLFDVFRGGSLPEGRRSLAFALRFQAPDRTLADSELAALRSRIVEAVEGSLPARLRG